MIGPTDVIVVHDFTGNPDYPLPHVIVLEAPAGTMMLNEDLFTGLAKQGQAAMSYPMLVEGDDAFTMRVRYSYHFELKSDLMHFRLKVK